MPRSTAQTLQESNRIGVQFLLADLTTALTVLDLADVAGLAQLARMPPPGSVSRPRTETSNFDRAARIYPTSHSPGATLQRVF